MNSDIPLTAASLKRLAIRLKKAKGLPHHQALDEAAKQHRYANWRHFLKSQSASTVLRPGADNAAANTLRCPHCSAITVDVHAVVTEPDIIPVVSMRWLPVERPSEKAAYPYGIAQAWGANSDMRCTNCGFEALAARFGFKGDDVFLNHGPATLGLLRPPLRATARLSSDGIILYSQEDAGMKDRPLRPEEFVRQLWANGGVPENIDRFLAALENTGAAEFSQPRRWHGISAG